ncbi:unnamed protein product, partial [marine sediment metagenome]
SYSGQENPSLPPFVLDEMENNFYNKLTPIQKKILEYRRDGKTIVEIKDELNESYGTIWNKINNAKKVASKEFDISYV